MAADFPPSRIRPVRDTDLAAMRVLRLEALRFHPLAFTADLSEAEARTDAEWLAWMRGRGGDADALMVAEAADGRLIGMTGIYTPPEPKLRHSGVIWGVYVREAYRRQGIGSALLRACLDWAASHGLRLVRLSSIADNPAARASYERAGFVPYGVEPDAVMYEGRYYDEVLMYRRVAT